MRPPKHLWGPAWVSPINGTGSAGGIWSGQENTDSQWLPFEPILSTAQRKSSCYWLPKAKGGCASGAAGAGAAWNNAHGFGNTRGCAMPNANPPLPVQLDAVPNRLEKLQKDSPTSVKPRRLLPSIPWKDWQGPISTPRLNNSRNSSSISWGSATTEDLVDKMRADHAALVHQMETQMIQCNQLVTQKCMSTKSGAMDRNNRASSPACTAISRCIHNRCALKS